MVKRISWKSSATLLLLVGSLLFSGCSLGAGIGGVSPNATSDSNNLPLTAKLAFGTFKLEGTQEAVSAEQAAVLLPLWKAARYLATTDAAAPGEVTAIYKQIEGTMSAEQMKVINSMKRADLGGIARQMGLQGMPIQDGRPNNGQAAGPSNQARLPEGGGGFVPGMGGPPRPESNNNAEAGAVKERSTTAVPAAVYDSLIKLLQRKVQ